MRSNRRRQIAGRVGLALLGGCAPRAVAPPAAVAMTVVAKDDAPVLAPAMSELDARVLVAAGLRAAGLRVRQDVAVAGVVLDGWDPERKVGYEYVAAGDAPVSPAVRAGLGSGVLVIDAAAEPVVRAALASFVAGLGAQP